MGFFDFLRREATASPTSSKTTEGASVPSRRVFISSADRAMEVAAFFHAIDMRSTTAARATLRYERFQNGKWKEFSFGSNRHLNWLLQVRPNDIMTADQMWKLAFQMRDLDGSAGIYLDSGSDGTVKRLIPVKLTWNQVDNTYTCVSSEYGKTWINVPADSVVVLKGVVRPGFPMGRSLLHYMQRTLSTSATGETLCLDVMSKGGTFKAIVKQEMPVSGLSGLSNYDDSEARSNTDSINDQFAEGKDFIYDPSASDITPITQSFQDLQVDLQRNKAIEDIARFTKVPLPLMFCATNAVYKSIDDAWHTFKELTIKPILEEVEQELNSKLLGEEDFGKYRFRFDTDSLCLDTDKGKAEVAQIYVNTGVKTRNEVREELNLEPLEKGTQPTATEGEEGGAA